jgi:hypothetical protein
MSKEISLRKIYSNFETLIKKVERESPLLSNSGIGFSFSSKFMSLEIMQKHTIEKVEKLFDSYKEEKDSPTIFPEDTNKYFNESIAFFEAYFNAFYSFLQIIGKVTPYFYDPKTLKNEIPNRYFGSQIHYFKKEHPEVDYEYSNYLKNNMSWYYELINNRNAITHNASAFLGFGTEEIVFIHMPKRRIDFFENGKPTRKLGEYISSNWISLFKFLDFCVNHFSNREIFVNKEKELETMRKLLSQNSPTL